MKKNNLIILIVLSINFLISCGGSDSSDKPLVLSEQEKKVIDMAVSDGYIRLVPNLNEVWVKPIFWTSLTYENKERLGAICAVYCANEKGTKLYWVNIKDDNSGKKLAKWSKSWGFEIY